MNFLEMKSNLKPPLYEWYRGVSGSWYHWEKRGLDGQVILHVEGSEDIGYWGSIRTDSYGDGCNFWSTVPDDERLHIPFRTPENCAAHVDLKWQEIVRQEYSNIIKGE